MTTPEDFLAARAVELAQQPGYDYKRWSETLRAVMLLHRPVHDACVSCGSEDEGENSEGDRTFGFLPALYPCQTMRVLLVQYDDHPDYDPRWRP